MNEITLLDGKEIVGFINTDDLKIVNNNNINKFAVFQEVPSTQQKWTLCFNKTNKKITLPFTCYYVEFQATFPKHLVAAVVKEVLGTEYIKNIHIEAIGCYEKKLLIEITINAVYATSVLAGRPCDVVNRIKLFATMGFN